jgi:hypothetical protein
MAPQSGNSVWDHQADKDLLLAIIENSALKGIKWEVIAGLMQSKGHTFTNEGCRYVEP